MLRDHFALSACSFVHIDIWLSFLLPLSFRRSFSHHALRVPFPVSRARNTSNLLAAQIEIEQPPIKRKWGYWPVPLSLVIDFHFAAAPHFTRRASRTLLFFSQSNFLVDPFTELLLIISTSFCAQKNLVSLIINYAYNAIVRQRAELLTGFYFAEN